MQLGLYQVMSGNSYNGPTFKPQQTLAAMNNLSSEALTSSMIKVNALATGKTLEAQLDAIPTKYLKDLNDTYFDIVASSRRNIPLLRATKLDGTPITAAMNRIGAAGEPFFLFFPENYFFMGETLEGEKNEQYPVRVIKEEGANGTEVKYRVEMFGRPNGMPGSELVLGKKFSKGTAPAERGMSREQGGITRPSMARVKTYMSTIRIDHKVPGDINDYGMVYSLPVIEDGKVRAFNVTSSYEEFLVEEQFAAYKAHALYYGTTNIDANGETFNKGQSGNNIIFGSGLRELTEQSNKYYFNNFSLDLLENATNTLIAEGVVLPGTVFTIRTGNGGQELISKAIAAKAAGWTILSNGNAPVITSVNSPLHTNALSFGALFVQYKAPNGAIFNIEVDASYNDPVRNKIKMPGRNLPAESYRMDITFMGTPENPNVQKLGLEKLKSIGGEYRNFGGGFRNPLLGEGNNPNGMAYTEDSAFMTIFTHLGIAMYDVDKSISLIPIILA